MQREIDQLVRRIDGCMPCDRASLRHRVKQLRQRAEQGKPFDLSLVALTTDIEQSRARCAARRANVPTPTYPDDLPVAQRRSDIAAAIRENQVIVVCGETGSGKTTQLPKICLELGRGIDGIIGHTQPRRIAARSLAARIARELRTPLGQAVGYKIRFGDRTSPDTYIKIMTDGILLAETQGDHRLTQYDTIIIDEAHERSLNVDFLLGYLKQLLPRRPDLKVIITSATIDPQRFSKHFDDAPVIEVSGRTYPVETRYRPVRSEDINDSERDVQLAILDAVDELATISQGDVLIFLSGERDIRETAEALRKHHPPGTEILPLYARLSAAEQDKVFRSHPGRRIILATNVAETSLTVPGIRYVVDPGFARISRYSHRSRVQRLPIESVSQASADQRKGRCGRVAEGVCIRLYDEEDYEGRDRYTAPEIVRTNLASVILQMKALRLGAVEEFPFIDPPDRRLIRDGYQTLHELGAIDDVDQLTSIGRQLSRLPIDPKLGRMLLAADSLGSMAEVLIIASALSVQDPRERPMDQRDAADAAHERFRDEKSDFLSFLKLWEFYHDQARRLSQNKMRKLCRTSFLSYMRMREWHDIHQQLRVLLTGMGFHPNTEPAEYEQIHRAILTGLIGNVGLLTDAYEYTGVQGGVFYIFPGSSLFKHTPRWIVAGEIVRTTKLYARSVATIEPKWIESQAPHLVKRAHSNPAWNGRLAQVNAQERVTLYGLPIVQGRSVHYGPINPQASRELFIHHALVLGEHQTRARFARHNDKLMDKVRALEDKCRKHDILADAEQMYPFFDRVIPDDVYSGATFERWRKKAERDEPNLLCMELGDVMHRRADEVTPARYPDDMKIGDVLCGVSYRLAPGESDDGTTLRVPLAGLGQVTPGRCEWLVPGMLREKVIALIRSLPKEIRTNFIPVPDWADACLAALAPGDMSLVDAVAAQLSRLSGVTIPRDAWNVDALPDHLSMTIAVVDDEGKELARDKDLRAISKAVDAEISERLASAPDSALNRDDITAWDFGDLPECAQVKQAGGSIVGYPALVDRGESVSLRLFSSREQASCEMPAGLGRLFALQVRRELDFQIKHLPSYEQMVLHHMTLGSVAVLRRDLLDVIVQRTFVADRPTVRSEAAFQARLDQEWDQMGPIAIEMGKLASDILALHHALAVRLDERAPEPWCRSLADIRAQLGGLLCDRFLVRTPYEWLQQYPRYLRAIVMRHEKIANGGIDRDDQRMKELAPLLHRFTQLEKTCDTDVAAHAVAIELRWLLEELRVSLFAQQLGTVAPVSIKRLEKRLDALGA